MCAECIHSCYNIVTMYVSHTIFIYSDQQSDMQDSTEPPVLECVWCDVLLSEDKGWVIFVEIYLLLVPVEELFLTLVS